MSNVIERAINDALQSADGTQMPFDGCLIWLADIYQAALGADPAKAWRGRYADEDQMKRILGVCGVAGALWRGARDMGWPRIEPDAAQTGDLGMIVTQDGPAGVIKNGSFWVGRDDFGFSVCDASYVRRAWKVA